LGFSAFTGLAFHEGLDGALEAVFSIRSFGDETPAKVGQAPAKEVKAREVGETFVERMN
jgi:hypothetical protein